MSLLCEIMCFFESLKIYSCIFCGWKRFHINVKYRNVKPMWFKTSIFSICARKRFCKWNELCAGQLVCICWKPILRSLIQASSRQNEARLDQACQSQGKQRFLCGEILEIPLAAKVSSSIPKGNWGAKCSRRVNRYFCAK